MHRLFVAIRPPAPIRDRLIDLMEGLPGARWQDEDQLHLTLRFIGEVEGHVANDVHAALAAIRQPRFALSLAGIGSFTRRGRLAALWAGVAPHEPLNELHKKVDQACRRAGLDPEHRAYHPHITLARFGRDPGAIDSFLAAAGKLSSPPFPVESFCLYESELSAAGATYSIVERHPLG